MNRFKDLFHRLQYIECNGISSLYNEIRYGASQRSNHGPLLFLVILILLNSLNIMNLLFVDDTNLLCSHDNISSLTNSVNSELCQDSECFQARKLFINN